MTENDGSTRVPALSDRRLQRDLSQEGDIHRERKLSSSALPEQVIAGSAAWADEGAHILHDSEHAGFHALEHLDSPAHIACGDVLGCCDHHNPIHAHSLNKG